MPQLHAVLVPAHGQVVVRLTGDADLSTAPLVEDALVQAAALGTPQLVVDVAAARFWDSSCLRTLAAVTAELAAAGRACRVVGAGAATRRLVRAAMLTDGLVLDGAVADLPGAPAPNVVAEIPERRRPAPLPSRGQSGQRLVGAPSVR